MCLKSSNNKIPESIFLLKFCFFCLLLIKVTGITRAPKSQSPLCMSSTLPQSSWCALLWLSLLSPKVPHRATKLPDIHVYYLSNISWSLFFRCTFVKGFQYKYQRTFTFFFSYFPTRIVRYEFYTEVYFYEVLHVLLFPNTTISKEIQSIKTNLFLKHLLWQCTCIFQKVQRIYVPQ